MLSYFGELWKGFLKLQLYGIVESNWSHNVQLSSQTVTSKVEDYQILWIERGMV